MTDPERAARIADWRAKAAMMFASTAILAASSMYGFAALTGTVTLAWLLMWASELHEHYVGLGRRVPGWLRRLETLRCYMANEPAPGEKGDA